MQRLALPGTHLRVARFIYSHHGIYWGVHAGLHVVAELAKPNDGGVVRFVPWDTFSRGASVDVVDHPDGLPLQQVLENVQLATHWSSYDLLNWNCEHFATWCATYRNQSAQIDTVRQLLQATVLVGSLALINSVATART